MSEQRPYEPGRIVRSAVTLPLIERAEEGEADDRFMTEEVVITSEHIDSAGDIIRARGVDLSEYKLNPIVMLQHGRTLEFPVIGGNAIVARGRTADGVPAVVARRWQWGDTELGREIRGLWNDGILRTVSVGVMPLEWIPIDGNGKRVQDEGDPAWIGYDFRKSMLKEFSVVAIPMNVNARRKMAALMDTLKRAPRYFDIGARAVGEALTVVGAVSGVEDDDAEAPEAPEVKVPRFHNDGFKVEAGFPAPRATDPQEVGRLLKGITIERCSTCGNAIPYIAEVQRFVEHRTKEGPLCPGAIVDEAGGPSLKSIADAIRDGSYRPPIVVGAGDVPHDAAGGLLRALITARDVEGISDRLSAVVREVDAVIKSGRVLSAETRKTIEGALARIETASDDMRSAIDATSAAAGAMRAFLSAADGEPRAVETERAPDAEESVFDRVARDPRMHDFLQRFGAKG